MFAISLPASNITTIWLLMAVKVTFLLIIFTQGKFREVIIIELRGIAKDFCNLLKLSAPRFSMSEVLEFFKDSTTVCSEKREV